MLKHPPKGFHVLVFSFPDFYKGDDKMNYEKEIEFGNLIHKNNKIGKYTTYQFESIRDLKEFWQTRCANAFGDWTAHIDKLIIECFELVDAKVFFDTIGEEE